MATLQMQPNEERRLLMLGRTGAGMTSTANKILFESIFEERADTRSKTQLCEFAQRTIHGRRLKVFDTPGFFNTEKPQNITELEIDRCVPMALPGPHAFLLVISMTNRFPPEAQEAIRRIEAKFGKDIYKYLIIVFTGKDTLDSEGRDFSDFLQNGLHPMIEDVLRKCSNRCVAFNNKADTQENSIQVKALLDVVDGMVAQNKGGSYSAENFSKTSQRLRRKWDFCVLSIQERLHFNLGMFHALVRIMMLIVLLSSLYTLISILLRYSASPTGPKPVVTVVQTNISDNGTKLPLDNNHTKASASRNITDDQTIRPRPLPLMKSYLYAQVMFNVLGQGVCLLQDNNSCFPQWLQPMKAPKVDLIGNIYVRVMLSVVNRGWSLPRDHNRNGLWAFSPFESIRDFYVNIYERVMLTTIGRGWSLSDEYNRTVLKYFEPRLKSKQIGVLPALGNSIWDLLGASKITYIYTTLNKAWGNIEDIFKNMQRFIAIYW